MSGNKDTNEMRAVNAQSVPRCLQHTMPCMALEEATWIAEFLGAACEALLVSDDAVSAEVAAGYRVCNTLLLDKLAIASGALPFPLTDMFNQSEAVLWKPEPKEAADADA